MKGGVLIVLVITLKLSNAFANAEQYLLNAITTCKEEANPLNMLQKMEGNSFSDTKYENDSESAIITNIVLNPRLRNPLIGAPTRAIGKIKVEMNYPLPGRGLVCNVVKL